MLQENISSGVENPTDLPVGKRTNRHQSGGLKQRMKPLSDVKNTLEAHSTNLIGKKGNTSGKKIIKGSHFSGLEKSKNVLKNNSDNLTNFGTKECSTKKNAEDNLDDEIHNHFACEEANDVNQLEYLDEYRLTKREIDFFGDRLKLFTINRFPLRLKPVVSSEDLEVIDVIKPSTFDENESIDDVMSTEVPPPSFLY